ncbi:MAG: hypothetical protein KDI30_07415 [Pseudomonadales bacterium]|nr:hypothetical protein [Pseudomonadales bacterium]
MVKRLTSVLLLLASLCCGRVFALGLGDIIVDSTVNEPFSAVIALTSASDFTEEQLLVELAKEDDFKRLGAIRKHYLTGLKFKLDLKHISGPVILVSSREVIKEPYMDFVVDLQWPGGRIVKEYVVLLPISR